MEQEEEIGSEASAGHHDAVLGEEHTPRGEPFEVPEVVTLVGDDGDETQVND